MRRVVITGIGAESTIGSNYDELLESIKTGKCGISTIEGFDTSDIDVKIAGEIKDFDPSEYIDRREARRMDKVSQYGVVAAYRAFEDSGFKKDELKGNVRAAVIVASGIGGLETIEKEVGRSINRGINRMSPFFIPMSIINMTSAQIGIALGVNGENYAPVTACAASADAIGQGFRSIKDGYSDIVFAGGAEAAITPVGVGGFASMKALSTSTDPNRGSIPFDKERDGFVMGEGAGIIVLEELEHAKARGAKIYGEVVGYGASSDAFHITAPHEDGKFAAIAMEKAIASANINGEDIDYINAHGTSTPLNDKTETKAIKRVFGDYARELSISSTKSMTGHLLGASGVIEGILSTIALNEQIVPATINYKVPDPECDLDYTVNHTKERELQYAMSNSLGFGGHNSSIIIKRWQE